MQMARPAKGIRLLAHNLHPHEQVGQERRPAPRLRASAARRHDERAGHRDVLGQHKHTGSPRRNRGVKKNGPQSIGRSRGGLNTKLHLVAADERRAVVFCISPGEEGDAPWGRELIGRVGKLPWPCALAMDRAYEGDATRALAQENGFLPVVPPNPGRKEPWEYDKVLYKRRNEVERLFRRVEQHRRIFTRYDKLDVIFMGFLLLAFAIEFLKISVNTP